MHSNAGHCLRVLDELNRVLAVVKRSHELSQEWLTQYVGVVACGVVGQGDLAEVLIACLNLVGKAVCVASCWDCVNG